MLVIDALKVPDTPLPERLALRVTELEEQLVSTLQFTVFSFSPWLSYSIPGKNLPSGSSSSPSISL